MKELSTQKRKEMKDYLGEAGMFLPSRREKIAHLSGRYSKIEIDLFLGENKLVKNQETEVHRNLKFKKIILWNVFAVLVLCFRFLVLSKINLENFSNTAVLSVFVISVLKFVTLIIPIAIVVLLTFFFVKYKIREK